MFVLLGVTIDSYFLLEIYMWDQNEFAITRFFTKYNGFKQTMQQQ